MRGKGVIDVLVPEPFGITPAYAGKVFIGQVCIAPKGITPAYAGKRFTLYLRLRVHWDHPRVCGEKGKHDVK